MNKIIWIGFLVAVSLGVITACTKEAQPPECLTPCPSAMASRKILILGNSITQHGPLPTEGWLGNWGMAASALEKDYVHVTIDSLKRYCTCVKVEFKALNISSWEMNFDFDFSGESGTKDLQTFQPDILIVRLGENVKEEYARSHGYEDALKVMIDRFKGPSGRVLITGNFWPNAYKDEAQKNVADTNTYEFVPLNELAADETNKALDHFQGGVGQHPSDKGMREIADRVVNRILSKNWYVEKVN